MCIFYIDTQQFYFLNLFYWFLEHCNEYIDSCFRLDASSMDQEGPACAVKEKVSSTDTRIDKISVKNAKYAYYIHLHYKNVE